MEHFLSVSKHARYSMTGDPQFCKQLWVVCHGYGQLSKFFIRKFETLISRDICIVAPEGLHRFYLNGHSGRVGASWMTSEEREKDILDYVNYLDDLCTAILPGLKPDVKITGLGFSQGGATISRWASMGKIKPHNLVLWSSVFPPDLPASDSLQNIKGSVTCVYGDEDEFITATRFKEQFELIRNTGLEVKELPFNGKHDIIPSVLETLAEQLELNS